MLSTYFKITFRQLLKNKGQSAILIGGLAAGMAACILLLQYVNFELGYDDFHSKKDLIYRVVNERIQNGKTLQKGTITYPTIGAAMQRDFPEIANHTRMALNGSVFIRFEDKLASHEGMMFADEHFFEMFDFPMLAQAGDQTLRAVNEVVVCRSVADQYFPEVKGRYDKVLGKAIFVNADTEPYKIVGVCADVPSNSFLQFQVLVSYATFIKNVGKDADESWTWSDFWHFIELKPGTEAKKLEAKLPAFSKRHFRDTEVSGSKEVFTLQALNDAHLYSASLEYEIGKTSNGRAVWSLLIIAFFILVLAWINYINLSSVRVIERSKEVGLRKVVGARRAALVGQFLTEALVVNTFALALAGAGAWVLKAWFAQNFGLESADLQFIKPGNLTLPLAMFGLLALGVLFSGIYPAWLLSSPHIASVLKGTSFKKSGSGERLRQGLVVFQFTASIALITATWLVSRQIQYMSNLDLGTEIEQIVTLNGAALTQWDSTFITKANAFKAKLLSNPHILSAASSNRTIDDGFHGRAFQIEKTSDHPSGEMFSSSHISTDQHYAETYGLKPLAGRFFRETDYNTDAKQVDKIVINESAMKMLGYATPELAINQTLKIWDQHRIVVGVLPDFHDMSLHSLIEPLIFFPYLSTNDKISLRTDGQEMEATLGFVQATFKEFFPGNVFEYEFLDEAYQQVYEADRRFGRILGFFTLLTLLIACLGLFGLASYLTFLKTKEIGVRKVLGASVLNIVTLLSKDFLKLVLIAILIASPIAWYLMNRWLADFAYRIQIQWWMFVAAGAAAALIAFLTVGFQSVKAALANPVKSLRSE